MADITMCTNKECSIKNNCYRYTATPTPMMQSCAFYTQNVDEECCMFWDNSKRRNYEPTEKERAIEIMHKR